MTTTKRHIIYWTVIYFLWAFMKSSGGKNIGIFFLVNLVNIPIYMAAFYLLKHVQIPYLYNKKKMILFGLSIPFIGFILYFTWRVAGRLWLDDLRGLQPDFMRFDRYLFYVVQFYSPAVLLLAWEIQDERRKDTEQLLELEKEKISTELKFLKAQLNPHFLFNSFNNLYSLVINGDPKGPKMILQLSAILDYILYKSQQDVVPLSEEIHIVNEYIALEKIRYGERLIVDLECSGDQEIPISPLLILTLVENAFKHGASMDIDTPKIIIDINVEKENIICRIWNTKSAYSGESKDVHKKGIGLSNVKRQLELRYPNQHDLTIKETEKDYQVDLTLING